MRTIQITPELRAFADDIYKVDFSKQIESIKEALHSQYEKFDFKYPIVKQVLFYFEKNLDCFLRMTPEEMNIFLNGFTTLYGCSMNLKVFDRETEPELKYWLKKIFNYNSFRDIIRQKLIKKLGIKACIYCNAQLTIGVETDYISDKKGKATFQLDHFFPQTEFPFFSISFFNLIPCCGTCNNAKRDNSYALGKDFHLYTKEDSISYFKFSVDKPSKVRFLSSKDVNDLKIKFKGKDSRYDNHAAIHDSTFSIERIYETQKDIVEELFQKKEIYTEDYKNDLTKLLGEKWNNKTSLDRLILGNYHLEEDIHKRPFAKFTQDIAKELGLIK